MPLDKELLKRLDRESGIIDKSLLLDIPVDVELDKLGQKRPKVSKVQTDDIDLPLSDVRL